MIIRFAPETEFDEALGVCEGLAESNPGQPFFVIQHHITGQLTVASKDSVELVDWPAKDGVVRAEVEL